MLDCLKGVPHAPRGSLQRRVHPEKELTFNGMNCVHSHAAGVDVGADGIVACVVENAHTQVVRSFAVDLRAARLAEKNEPFADCRLPAALFPRSTALLGTPLINGVSENALLDPLLIFVLPEIIYEFAK